MKLLRILFLLISVGILFSCSEEKVESKTERAVFMVSYPSGYSQKTETIFLSLSDLEKHYGLADMSKVKLVSMNNHKQIPFNLYDLNGDKLPELVGFKFNIIPGEPLRPLMFCSVENVEDHSIIAIESYTNNVEISYLQSAKQYISDSLIWSKTVANTFMELYPEACDLEVFSPNKWTYTNGFFINALCELFVSTQDSTYIQYAKRWIDCFIASDGTIAQYSQKKYRLDDVLPARSLLSLYSVFNEDKYKIAATNFIHHIENQPRNSDGGYWHKLIYAHQMWLDGIYMGDVYTSQYAKMFNEPELFDEAITQIKLIYKHTLDSNTGLMYHGYDEMRNDVWANAETGTSPEFWGRGMGWYMMSLVDVLDYLPADHSERDTIISILNKTCEALANVQDSSNGLWYQVLDKGSLADNWIETSCSAMFAYAYAKGAKNGYLPETYLQKSEKAFNSLINDYVYFDAEGRFYLTETVYVGTLNFKSSDGSYNYYINVDRRINDFKGVAAFLYLAMALDK